MLNLDEIDYRLLERLQRDGKASLAELAQEVGLSSTPCWRRIKRLEDAGVIAGYAAQLVPKALGLNARAYVFVSLTDHREETTTAFSRLVETEDRIMECASVTGRSDFILLVATQTPEELEGFLMKVLLASGLVKESQTHFVLRQTKVNQGVPLLRD